MSSDAAALPPALDAAAQKLLRARDVATSISPRYVLGTLLVVQWLAVLALALTVKHNGWLYYAGGDQLWHYSGAYLMAHGDLPPTFVGYGWSFLLLPVAAIAGPNLVSALPAIVLFNTLVLLPVALLCVYGIGARIAGRLFGYFAAAFWIALPYLGIVFVEPGYHQKYTELTLPQLLGLASVPDFPATVALLVAAYFCLRTLDSPGWHVAAAAGLAAGYSIAIKPSNSIFLVASVVLVLVEKRRALVPLAAGLAPALLTLAIWKYRGLGELAAAPAEPVRLAGGVGDLLDRVHNPELNSFAHFRAVLDALREHFWAARVIEWLPVAGAIGCSRGRDAASCSWRRGSPCSSWPRRRTFPRRSKTRSFWRIMMPRVPRLPAARRGGRAARPGRARTARAGLVRSRGQEADRGARRCLGSLRRAPPRRHRGNATAPGRRTPGRDRRRQPPRQSPPSSASRRPPRRRASGFRGPRRGRARRRSSIACFRKEGPADVFCAGTRAADQCRLYPDLTAATRGTSYVDRPGKGTWTYRIGVSANWLDDERLGDVYVVSRPETVTVP